MGHGMRVAGFAIGVTFAAVGTLATTTVTSADPDPQQAALISVRRDGQIVKAAPTGPSAVLIGESICRAIAAGSTPAKVQQALVTAGLNTGYAARIVSIARANYCPGR